MRIDKISFGKTNEHNNSYLNINLSKNQAYSIGAFSIIGGMIAGADCYENVKKSPKPNIKSKIAYSSGYGARIGLIIASLTFIGVALYNKFIKKSA